MGLAYLEERRFCHKVDGQRMFVAGCKCISLDLVEQVRRGAVDGGQGLALGAQLRQRLQQRPGVGVPCVVEDLFHGAVLDDLARVHNGHAVGHVCHNAQVMGDVDDRHAQLFLQVTDQLQDLRLNGHVQCGGGLVADQDLRAAGRCNGDDDTLAHTAGELVRVLFVTALRVRDADLGQHLDGSLFGGLAVQTLVVLNALLDLLADLLQRVQAGHRVLHDHGETIAMVMQDPMTSLNPLKKIGKQIQESIEHHQGLHGEAAKKAAIEMLAKVGIPDPERRYEQYPHEFSGGMRQRVVIAIAAACRPQILICDEPTTALDVTIQAQILQLIRDLQKELGMSVIYITHDLGVVANVADRVAVMYAGQIVEYGTVEEIFYDAWHPYTWALLQALPQLGTKGEALPTIDGTPPNLFNEIKGDAFAPRNKHALAIDFVAEPPFFQVSETHAAKTWYLDPRAPKMERPHSIQNLREKMGKMGGSNFNG